MRNDRRLRCLVVDEAKWYWTVRQRVRPTYAACSTTLTLRPEGVRAGLVLVFRPGPDRIIANTSFDSGALIRLPDRDYLNLYEPATVRRLLDAATGHWTGEPVELDGWPYFDAVVDRSPGHGSSSSSAS
ncbi:hypothetical protein ACFVVM_06070 [Nocardia sp. NPDC058176]|uniref:hypothetical protein n=1 Tax=Nocardia sp. NPDC058176 TaxID=3346368 RepID=UPI0036DF7FE7